MAAGTRIPFSGILLIVFGALFLADQLGAISFGQAFSTWWPVLLVLAGVLSLVERPGSPFMPVILIMAGAVLLLSNLGYLHIGSVWRLWPLLLIAVGLNIVFGGGGGRGRSARA